MRRLQAHPDASARGAGGVNHCPYDGEVPGSDRTDAVAVMTDGIVRLRPVVRGDVAALVEAVRSSLDLLWPWMFWATGDYGTDHANGFVDAVEKGQEHAFVIAGRGDRLLGLCDLNKFDEPHRTANLGYGLRADATGAGLATRAARLVIVHGFDALALERIEVVMSVHNDRSRRVPERLGLISEGIRGRALRIGDEQHDAHVFAAFRDDLARLCDG